MGARKVTFYDMRISLGSPDMPLWEKTVANAMNLVGSLRVYQIPNFRFYSTRRETRLCL